MPHLTQNSVSLSVHMFLYTLGCKSKTVKGQVHVKMSIKSSPPPSMLLERQVTFPQNISGASQ